MNFQGFSVCQVWNPQLKSVNQKSDIFHSDCFPSPGSASSPQYARWCSISGITLACGLPPTFFFFFLGCLYYFLISPLLWPSILIIHKFFQNILRELHKGKFWRRKIQGRKIGYWNILGFPSICCKLLPG